ncbi:MAG: phosphoglycerate mutase [Lysobacteraceae bacterium]
MGRVCFLLPAPEHMDPVPVGSLLSRCLPRGDSLTLEPGDEAQLMRHVDVLPRRLSMAAVSRQYDCGDALGSSWLRADPVLMQADMTTGRLMAHGNLALTPADVESLLRPLKPLFGDEGFPISPGTRSAEAGNRWYLQLPFEAELPDFVPPEDALGADLGDCLPAGDIGRRWRRLFSEAQIVLHNHELNARRRDAGLPSINGIWFWGGGRLPDNVTLSHANVVSGDARMHMLLALSSQSSRVIEDFEAAIDKKSVDGDWLVDLRQRRDAGKVVEAALPLIQRHLAEGEVAFDFSDGRVVTWRRAHRWRFWRRG